MKPTDRISFELSILKSILSSSSNFRDIVNFKADPCIFKAPQHRILFTEAMNYFHRTGKTPDVSSLYEELLISRADDSIKAYLKNDVVKVDLASKTLQHFQYLIEDNIETEIKDALNKETASGLEYATAVSDIANKVIGKYVSSHQNTETNSQVSERVLSNIRAAMQGNTTDYIKTGFPSIDKHIIGIPKKHLTIIAARPGMGKTAFMLQLQRNFRAQGYKVGCFSMEMDTDSLWIRNLSELSGIDSIKIESGNLTAAEYENLEEAATKLSQDDYIIDDRGRQTPRSIKAQINLWKANNQVDIVLIDYLTLVKTSYGEQRKDLEIAELSSELRIFAKDTGIPIIILSQLNRDCERRPDKRPMLADLRESGAIEQDAKLVMFLYRPMHYGIDPFKEEKGGNKTTFYTSSGQLLRAEEYLEVLISKARNGRTGSVPLRYIQPVHRFETVSAKQGLDYGVSRSTEDPF